MEIIFRGKNIKVASGVQELAREKLAKFERFNLKITRIEVDFSEIRNPRVHDKDLCEVTVHLKGHFVKAHAASTDPIAALDLVIDKVEHQLTPAQGEEGRPPSPAASPQCPAAGPRGLGRAPGDDRDDRP